jgi:hypothetical protein
MLIILSVKNEHYKELTTKTKNEDKKNRKAGTGIKAKAVMRLSKFGKWTD